MKLAATKKYAPAQDYEKKLARVMERFGVKQGEWNFNYDRQGHAFVEFRYKGELYRFEHSVENAKTHGIILKEGKDAFKQIVLALEDLARMAERGIYELQTWIKGMKFLPQAVEVPSFLKYLGFADIPKTEDEVKAKYKEMAMIMHPDKGGDADDFNILRQAYEKSLAYVGKKG